MKNIRLLTLTLDNFKGCRHTAFDFGGRSAAIYGDNAAGKTTLYDGLTWLLFGKDSKGRSDFEIKPVDNAGQVRDHAAITSVEAILDVDGQPLSLRKTYFEKWSAKRGSSEASFDGHASEYFVDGVPSKKYEFEQRAGELVQEDLFRILTDVTYFCGSLNWKNRRTALLDVCDVPDDAAILADNEQFAPLRAALGGLDLDSYKKKLLTQRKTLNNKRDAIPARLEEQQHIVQNLSDCDYDAVRREKEEATARLDQLSLELLKLEHGTLLDSKRNELTAARNNLRGYQNENDCHRQIQLAQIEDKRPMLRSELSAAQARADRNRALAGEEQKQIAAIQEQIAAYREEWTATDAEAFTASTCPTCKQALPADALRDAQARFEASKGKRLSDIVAAAQREKEALTAAEGRLDAYEGETAAAQLDAERLTKQLRDYAPPTAPEISDLPGHAERVREAENHIVALEAEVERLQGESAAIREEVSEKVSELRESINECGKTLALEACMKIAQQRAEELRQEARSCAQDIEALDRQLALCEEFTRFKVQYIEQSINGRFRLARFRLFEEQVNGGLADCCDVLVDGVPYGKGLNNAACFNVGIDVIDVLSQHYGIRVPLFLDNAESVTQLLPIDTQVIRLIVSAGDKELRCEL